MKLFVACRLGTEDGPMWPSGAAPALEWLCRLSSVSLPMRCDCDVVSLFVLAFHTFKILSILLILLMHHYWVLLKNIIWHIFLEPRKKDTICVTQKMKASNVLNDAGNKPTGKQPVSKAPRGQHSVCENIVIFLSEGSSR